MKTGIIKRVDHEAYSNEVRDVVCFCASCDPEGNGGKGGIVLNLEGWQWNNEAFRNEMIANSRFCPKCGKELDWNNVKACANMLS